MDADRRVSPDLALRRSSLIHSHWREKEKRELEAVAPGSLATFSKKRRPRLCVSCCNRLAPTVGQTARCHRLDGL
uniref:Uncharacterized protein n=1 Tax=Daphnia galeata TaxID=27404 RepID=A0A8J2RNU3_9CRUS|nr:unnamed protein product [Daphnia galeata]